MAAIEHTTVVARPVETVFSVVADPRNGSRWREDLIRVEHMSTDPLRVGSTWVEVIRTGRGDQAVPVEVTTFEPPRQVRWRVTGGPLRVLGDIVCERAAMGTRVTQRMDVAGTGVMWLLAPLIRRNIAKSVATNLENLRRALEASQP